MKQSNMKNLTDKWFEDCEHLFVKHLKEEKITKALEIGSYEGASTCWLLENCLGGSDCTITCIDSWEGGEEHSDKNMEAVYERFLANVKEFENKVEISKGYSFDRLVSIQDRKSYYDFIYIDGGHTAKDVIGDAVLAFPLLKSGGTMAFDDYVWCYGNKPNADVPKHAIDLFLEAYASEIVVMHKEQQVWIKKK